MVRADRRPGGPMLLSRSLLFWVAPLAITLICSLKVQSDGPPIRRIEVVNAKAQAATDKPKDVPRPTAKSKGEISFDDLVFDIEKGGRYEPAMLTEAIKALDGKKVKLRGFILPSTLFRETDINEFVLVRDNQECCFGPGAALYDCVVVNLVDGVTTDFTTRPVTVTGTFKLKEYKYPDDSGHFAIFNLLGTDVR
jgi:hypothetical protein